MNITYTSCYNVENTLINKIFKSLFLNKITSYVKEQKIQIAEQDSLPNIS